MLNIPKDLIESIKSIASAIHYIVVVEGNRNNYFWNTYKNGVKYNQFSTTADRIVSKEPIAYIANNSILKEKFSIKFDKSEDIYMDLINGGFDNAKVTIYMFNGKLDDSELYKTFAGKIDEVTNIGDTTADISVKSLTGIIDKSVSQKYNDNCRNEFGDNICQFDLSANTVSGTVTTGDADSQNSLDNSEFATYPNNYFRNGIVNFTSGKNAGKIIKINSHVENIVSFAFATILDIEQGDGYEVRPECDKKYKTCQKYNNTANFWGKKRLIEEYFPNV